MTFSIDVFWSFRSPYSYLATGRLVRLGADYDLDINVRPIYPTAIRNPEFFKKSNPLFGPYLFRDHARVAEMLGIPVAWPVPDPVVQDFQTMEIAADQPYVYRLTRLGVAAAEKGRGLPFIDQVSKIIWSGGIKGWNEGDHLAAATSRAGLELAELDREIEKDPERYDAVAAENNEALNRAGHWGVPTMVFEGEPFFGQDRIDVLVWRLKQKGLEKRR